MPGMFSGAPFVDRLMSLIPLILSLTVHEWAHAYSAFRLGDDTAAREGRLTLNPIPHIDPIGTILLPLLSPIPFGWAKPVPVNPVRFRRDVSMRTGMMITAAAGPLSNLAIAILCAVIYGILLRFGVSHRGVNKLLFIFITSNIGLFLFNFLPVPPLDGSRIVDGVLPYRLRPQWEQLQRYSGFLLLGVIFFAGSIIQGPFGWFLDHLQGLILAVAGRG
jgi:Zn-dependent protease